MNYIGIISGRYSYIFYNVGSSTLVFMALKNMGGWDVSRF